VVQRAPDAPYFVLDDGRTPWTPIGANEAITWPELAGLFRRRDLAGVEAHLRGLRASGVTVLRLMLEYGHGEHRYLEKPAGRFVPAMVQLWDDLFALCEQVGLRILLTPFDTFFLWRRWTRHPYNQRQGGPCAARTQLLACPTRAPTCSGGSPSPRSAGAAAARCSRGTLERAASGARGARLPGALGLRRRDGHRPTRARDAAVRARPSADGVDLRARAAGASRVPRAGLPAPGARLREHALLRPWHDRRPARHVAPAAATGLLVQQALAEVRDDRPFFESEHGPIHRFKDRHVTLPAAFDDEYFRHMQWAHLASGAAGGGMRWPNRHPHVLTPGMRAAQQAMAAFLPLVDWTRLRRRNLGAALVVRDAATGRALRLVAPHETTPERRPPRVRLAGCAAAAFGCGDAAQAIVYLLRTTHSTTTGGCAATCPRARCGWRCRGWPPAATR
jgi:mannan endo-1,4-beta-mannosidase